MDNQHRKIKGYRELSQAEIDLMNEVKAEGERLDDLLVKQTKADEQLEFEGQLDVKESARWRAIAKTHFQQGLMALTRAVAKPDFF